jgi:hypothetical protein
MPEGVIPSAEIDGGREMKISKKTYEFSDVMQNYLKVKFDRTSRNIELETNKPVTFHKNELGDLIELLKELQKDLEQIGGKGNG